MLTFYDHRPLCFWVITLAVAICGLWIALKDFWAKSRGPRAETSKVQSVLFAFATACTIFSGRWPYLFFRHYFNPDESQQIAAGITLAHRPWFWLDIDGHTAGPMDLYYLCIPAVWRGPIDYMSARASGLLMILGVLFFCYRIFRLQFSERMARVALFPLIVFFAWVADNDFVEISTEHMPVFLLTAGSYFFLRACFSQTKRPKSWFIAGLMLGLAPWAKLQAAVFTVGSLITAIGWCRSVQPPPRSFNRFLRDLAPFLGGLGTPTLLFGFLMVSTGQVMTFYQSYLAANLDYVYRGTAKFYLLSELWLFSCESGFFPLLFLGTASWVLAGWWQSRSTPRYPSRLKWFYGYVGLSFLTVISPGRPFLHYLLFMIPSLGLLAGCAWAESELNRTNQALGAAITRKQMGALRYALIWFVAFLSLRILFPAPFQGALRHEWEHPESRPAAVARRYLKTGDTLALWGWRPDIYVELQVPQGVRDGHTQREIEDTPFRRYYRQRYLADLNKNQPSVFIDVVGPDAFVFQDRKRFGFETFPELAAYIAKTYQEVDDSPLGRVFIRKDRLKKH